MGTAALGLSSYSLGCRDNAGFSLPQGQLAQPQATLSSPTRQGGRLTPGGPGDPNQCQQKERAATPESSREPGEGEGKE